MGDLIFVKETKYKNSCTKCGKEIPKESSCWWEKGTKNNYHNKVECKPISPAAEPKPAPFRTPKQIVAFKEEVKLPAPLTEEQASHYLVESIELVANAFDVEKNTIDPSNQIVGMVFKSKLQIQDQQFSVAMAKAVQKQKELNMGVFK